MRNWPYLFDNPGFWSFFAKRINFDTAIKIKSQDIAIAR
jgi:hypothetical protein